MFDITYITWMNILPIAAIYDTSGAWVDDTGHCFLTRVRHIGDASMYFVAWGAAVNLGTSMSEGPNRGRGRYAYFVRFRFALVRSRLYARTLDIRITSGDRSGPVSHVLYTPEFLVLRKRSSTSMSMVDGRKLGVRGRSKPEMGPGFGT